MVNKLDPSAPLDYHLDAAYTPRLVPDYFVDDELNATWQPDVYPEAAALAHRLGARKIVDFGCGTAAKLVQLAPEFEIVGIDFGGNIRACRERYGVGTWVEADFDTDEPVEIERFDAAVLVCADVIEHLVRPELLLRRLRRALDGGAHALVLSTPERVRTFGDGDVGPPINQAHTREWSSQQLESFMASEGFQGSFALTRSNDVMPYFNTILAVIPGDRSEDVAAVGEWSRSRRHWEEGAVQTAEQYRELLDANEWLKGQWEGSKREVEEQARTIQELESTVWIRLGRKIERWMAIGRR
jgi:SAM-dependent methyltransferase